MKKMSSIFLILTLFLTACGGGKAEWKTAKQTYSLLGFSVEYSYPYGYETLSSDDDAVFMILKDKSNTSDWSLLVDINDMYYTDFCDYKGECAESAADISKTKEVWILKYTEPYEQTVMLKWFECGKMLIVNKANDFELEKALEVADSIKIDVFGNDVR